ncbi:MAG TPA: DUF1365 family protein [Oligoflexia bacterium]|nr:DUF1365 family protein [Oligoflexia bacterium]HMP48477.1 DUF1365 family protein [Oligoflexia bacterium]
MSEVVSSSLFFGEVFHQRNTPKVHSFTYPLFTLRISIDELPDLSRKGFGVFSYNGFGIFSVFDRDYLCSEEGTIRKRLEKILINQGINEVPDQIDLVTNPRFLGYVFNPVSFFLCYRQNMDLYAVVAEVHNTFGEKHLYLLPESDFERVKVNGTSRLKVKGNLKKVFHVSPFFDREGFYRFVIESDVNLMDLRVSLVKDGDTVFTSRLHGTKQVSWSNIALLKAFARYPGSILLTMTRIIYQAYLLKFRRGLKVFSKPIAAHPMTIQRTGPGIFQRLSFAFISSFLNGVKRGQIVLRHNDGNYFEKSGEKEGSRADILIRNYDIFTRSLISGDIGFGESYVEKDWDSEDLVSILRFFCENMDNMDDRSILLSRIGRVFNTITHFARRNTITNSKENISRHYDLSNELFGRFLDKNMLYSSAVFDSGQESLEDAQIKKMNMLINYADLKSSDHLLEIGCGWGALAIHAAKTVGCRVTGITLSSEQKAWADRRIREEGLEDQVSVKLLDYRQIEGNFDKIISVEMIEAVGHAFLDSFFSRSGSLLKNNGRLVLQVITVPESRYDAYRKGCDWIQKYIFPGGHCPSVSALVESASKASGFSLQSSTNIGLHYATTLSRWRTRFNENFDEIRTFGFDERFKRMWNYYLAYCEAGFSSSAIHAHHMVFERSKSGNV